MYQWLRSHTFVQFRFPGPTGTPHDPQEAKNNTDVISLLRRAGYPYDTPGEFYAAAMRDFSLFIGVGGLLAGALAAMDMAIAAPFVALIFRFQELRQPYVRIKTLAKKRAELGSRCGRSVLQPAGDAGGAHGS